MTQEPVFDIPATSDYTVSVNGKPITVYAMPTRYGQSFKDGNPVSVYDGQPLRQPMYFACADIAGPSAVEVEAAFLPEGGILAMTAHPLSRSLTLERDGGKAAFTVDEPGSVTLLVNGDHRNRPLHIFFSPPVEAPPEGAIIFGPGFHDLGYDNPITLTDGQALYLAPGAWVEGIVCAKGARDIRIMGRGVLSQRRPGKLDYAGGETAPNGIRLANCRNVVIEGIVETRGIGGWCSLVTNCDRVEVRDYHVLASVVWSADGFNPCNSRDVTVERCFIRSGDDCIAIKGNTGGCVLSEPHIPPETQPPVENIHVRQSVFWCDHNEVFVIGCETRARHIRNISIRDCDVLFHWSSMDMGVFGILPLHGTGIRGIVYDDIRVEHCEEHLFFFRYCESIWSIPGDLTFPGTVADITIRNVSVLHAVTGPRSEISGYAPDKRFENISIENLRYGDKPVTDAAGMGLRLNEHVADLRFAKNGNMRENVLAYLKARGKGSYLFGQVATWVHKENPDMDHPGNWLRKVREHTGQLPRYGCITYDFDGNAFSDAAWNEGVRKLWDRGMIVGVYSFFANPSGGRWNDPVQIENIWAPGENAIKTNFYRQLDRMAANLQWLKERGIPVVYTPFVELDDGNKWHAKQGATSVIRLHRLVHDYFTAKDLDNLVWACHTTQWNSAKEYYPGDAYVDVIGKSAYGRGLPFDEYEWAVEKKQKAGKVIWWAELGIRDTADAPRDCFDVLKRLEQSFPELAGFVFWSDTEHHNVVGNLNASAFMAHPQIVTMEDTTDPDKEIEDVSERL